MKRFKKVIIPASVCIALGVSLALALAGYAQGSSAVPLDAVSAINAALDNDAEIADLRIRERYAYGNLYNEMPYRGVRINSDAHASRIGMGMYEHISDLHSIWSRMDMRAGLVTADVLGTIMAIDTELTKLSEFNQLLEDMAGWLEAAESDFRTARIDIDQLNNLYDTRDQARNSRASGELRLQTLRDRFRRLTGDDMPDDFDFSSAWLLVDVSNVDTSLISGPKPSMVFRSMSNIVTPPGEETSAETLIGQARLTLMSLHDALLNYEKMDMLVESLNERYAVGEIDGYTLYDAMYARVLSGISVYDLKNAYAASVLDLDRYSNGLVSSVYRAEPVEWFSEQSNALDGRYNTGRNGEYSWMKQTDGRWYLGASADDDRITLYISSLWHSSRSIEQVELHYDGDRIARGDPDKALTFRAPRMTGSSVIKAVFLDSRGYELYHVYIDGFANAGRFFWVDDGIIEPPRLDTPEITSYSLYKADDPDNPEDEDIVIIYWNPVNEHNVFFAGYLVEYKQSSSSDDDYISVRTNSTECPLPITILPHPGIPYDFRVTALSSDTARWGDSLPGDLLNIPIREEISPDPTPPYPGPNPDLDDPDDPYDPYDPDDPDDPYYPDDPDDPIHP